MKNEIRAMGMVNCNFVLHLSMSLKVRSNSAAGDSRMQLPISVQK